MSDAGTSYTAARASLRETAKWLVTVLSGLGAVLATGVSVSGLGALSGDQLLIAALCLAVVGVCLLAGIALMVRLMTVQDYFLSDVARDDEIRQKIEERSLEIMPPEYPTVAALKTAYENATIAVRQTNSAENINIYNGLSGEVGRVTEFAAFLDLSRQARRSMLLLGILAVIVFGGLGGYGWIVALPEAPAAVKGLFRPGVAWADAAGALSAACGDGPFAVDMTPQTALPEGWSAKIMAPSCAGVTLTLPSALVTAETP